MSLENKEIRIKRNINSSDILLYRHHDDDNVFVLRQGEDMIAFSPDQFSALFKELIDHGIIEGKIK